MAVEDDTVKAARRLSAAIEPRPDGEHLVDVENVLEVRSANPLK
jgi:hypothetical protein